jgi:hypothetical protein
LVELWDASEKVVLEMPSRGTFSVREFLLSLDNEVLIDYYSEAHLKPTIALTCINSPYIHLEPKPSDRNVLLGELNNSIGRFSLILHARRVDTRQSY